MQNRRPHLADSKLSLHVDFGNDFSWLTNKLIELQILHTNPAADAERAAIEREALRAAEQERLRQLREARSAEYQHATKMVHTGELVQEAIATCPDTTETVTILRDLRAIAVKLLPLAATASEVLTRLREDGFTDAETNKLAGSCSGGRVSMDSAEQDAAPL